jgi:hypothetical protein
MRHFLKFTHGNWSNYACSCWKHVNDFQGLICSLASISWTFSSLSTILFGCFFMSHTEPVCMHKGGPKTGPSTATFNDLYLTCSSPLFHKFGYTRCCWNWLVRIFTTKLMDTFSVSFFFAKDSTINTRYSVVNSISVDLLSAHSIYCTAARRSGMTPSVIWSYVSHLWEMFCLNEEDCAEWWKGSGYWGKTTNQSLKIVKMLSTETCVIASIAMDALQKMSHNLFMRCEACLQAEGGPFHHLL